MYAKFHVEILMGYDFTGGRISHFSIDFCMGLTTVQRKGAACDGGRPPSWIRCTHARDHQQSDIVGLYHCAKFGLNRLSSFDNMEV